MLARRNVQVETAKHRLSGGIRKIDIFESDAAAQWDQPSRTRLVDDPVISADDLDRIGDAGDELARVHQGKSKIARAVQDAEGHRQGQNDVAGTTLPTLHRGSVQPSTPPAISQRPISLEDTHALDIHQTVAMRALLDLEQPLEATALSVGAENAFTTQILESTSVSSPPSSAVRSGMMPVPRHAALAQPDQRARGQHHENE